METPISNAWTRSPSCSGSLHAECPGPAQSDHWDVPHFPFQAMLPDGAKIQSASELLPASSTLRVKGRTGASPATAEGAGGAAAESAGFKLGEEADGLVVAHHGSRVIVEVHFYRHHRAFP